MNQSYSTAAILGCHEIQEQDDNSVCAFFSTTQSHADCRCPQTMGSDIARWFSSWTLFPPASWFLTEGTNPEMTRTGSSVWHLCDKISSGFWTFVSLTEIERLHSDVSCDRYITAHQGAIWNSWQFLQLLFKCVWNMHYDSVWSFI